MKKTLTLFFVSSLLLFSSCVDKDFDIKKVNDDNIVFGDEFIIPMGEIKIKISDMVDFAPLTKATSTIQIADNYVETYNISSGFDKGILESLTSSGAQSIKAYIINPTPLTFKLKITFKESEEDATPYIIIDTDIVDSNTKGGKTEILKTITKEALEKISNSKLIKVELSVIGENKPITISSDANIKIDLKVIRKGGIKL